MNCGRSGVRFDEERFDEGAHQATMVDRLGVHHSEVRVANREIGKHFPEVVWHCEKPLLRTAPVPMYMLSDAVRRSGYKVVLTGEGADEIFGGYNIFREALLRRFWSRQPDSRLRPLLIGKLYPYIFNDPRLQNHAAILLPEGIRPARRPVLLPSPPLGEHLQEQDVLLGGDEAGDAWS